MICEISPIARHAMIEKIVAIKNPLTIIAMFAGIAEISGTVVLPFLDTASQGLFVWYLIVFPSLLVIAFFATLNFNHKVLYAPSDYKNEENFLRSLPKASATEKLLKIEAEISQSESRCTEAVSPTQESVIQRHTDEIKSQEPQSDSTMIDIFRRSAQARYMLAEDIVFRRLGKEFSNAIQREVIIGGQGRDYIFDGIVREKGCTIAIEVKLFRDKSGFSMHMQDALRKLESRAMSLPSEQTENFRIILAVVIDGEGISHDKLSEQIDKLRPSFHFPIELRVFSMSDLIKEYGLL